MTGAGVPDNVRIPDQIQRRWLEYMPEGAVLDRYKEIQEAIEEHNREIIKVQHDIT
jgi:hypothetical protein